MEKSHQLPFDVSLVINIHRGGPFLARTMMSLEDAARFARLDGLLLEVVFILDRSDPATRDWVQAYKPREFDGVQISTVEHGSLGLSRDYGMRLARGNYVMFADEDDLISFNSISELHRIAEEFGRDYIVVPQYLFGFGAKHVLAKYFGTDQVSPQAFISYHPFVSRIFFHNSIKTKTRFVDSRLSVGYAYEDWHFNASAYALGFKFRSAPDTILFYRHRPGLLESMNSMSTRQIPPTGLFAPVQYRKLCAHNDLQIDPEESPDRDLETVRDAFFSHAILREFVRAARFIEPAIDLDAMRTAPVMSNAVGDLRLGTAYLRACDIVGAARFTDVLFADETISREDIGHVIDALAFLKKSDPDFNLLVIDPAPAANRNTLWADIRRVVTVNQPALSPELQADDLNILTLRLIESTAPKARLHLMPGEHSHRFFTKYRTVLGNNRKFYYLFDQIAGAPAVQAISFASIFQFISDCLGDLDTVLTCRDHQSLYFGARLDLFQDKMQLLCRRRSLSTNTLFNAGPAVHRRLLFWSGNYTHATSELLAKLAEQLAKSGIFVDVHVPAGANSMQWITEYEVLNLAAPFDWAHASEHKTHDAIVFDALDEDLRVDPIDTTMFSIPAILLQKYPDTGRAANTAESPIVIATAETPERTAAKLVTAIEALYRNPVQLIKLKTAALSKMAELHNPKIFEADTIRLIMAEAVGKSEKPGLRINNSQR